MTSNKSSVAVAEHHAPDVSLYIAIFGTLLFLTLVTVGVSWLHLPKGPAVLIALMIATLKASLVAAFFMHLKGERLLIYGLLGLTVFFMAVLFLLPITDSVATSSRRAGDQAAMQASMDGGASSVVAESAAEAHVP